MGRKSGTKRGKGENLWSWPTVIIKQELNKQSKEGGKPFFAGEGGRRVGKSLQPILKSPICVDNLKEMWLSENQLWHKIS